MSHTLSRRAVLRQLGIGAGMLPILNSVPAFGAPLGYPKRLVIVVWSNGVIESQFWPQGAGTDLAPMMFPTITASLDPYKQDLLFINGLEFRNCADNGIGAFGHQTYATCFTGVKGTRFSDGGEPSAKAISASIDQVIADAVATQVTLPVRSLHLGAMKGGNAPYNCCFYRGAGQPVAPEQSPSAAASKLFTGATGTVNPDIAQLVAQRKSLLDFNGRDVANFGKNLGVDDKRTLAAHLDSVREVERQISRLSETKCNGVTVTDPARAPANYPQFISAHTDIIVNAFKCDLTRVATLQLSDYNGNGIVFPWLGDLGKATTFPQRDDHDLAHNPGTDQKTRADAWFVEQFAAMIKKFKAVPEGAGTMLDNTAILFANHMTNGARHDYNNLPWIIAGRGGGYFKPGRYLRAPTHTPANQLYVGLAEAMGVKLPNQTFGEYPGLLPDLSA